MVVVGLIFLITGDTEKELTTDARFYGVIGAILVMLSFVRD